VCEYRKKTLAILFHVVWQMIYLGSYKLSVLGVHIIHAELIMRSAALAVAIFAVLIAPAAAQKAQIEAANAKWVEFFDKGDFDGIASLYTVDATAVPPDSSIVKGRAAIAGMWKRMAEQVSDPKLTTIDVERLGSSVVHEIGTFRFKTKGTAPKEITGKYVVVWKKVGGDWKLATDFWNRGMNGRGADGHLFESFKHMRR